MNKEELGKLVWEKWENNWNNAKKFYGSKGNIKTMSKLKDKWHDEFMEDITDLLVKFANSGGNE